MSTGGEENIVTNTAADTDMRKVASLTSTMLLKCDAQQRFLFVNRAYAEHRGVPAEQIVGRTVREISGDEAYGRIAGYIERVLAGEAVEFEAQVPYPVLGMRTVAVSYVPERDASGVVCGWVSAITDVTEIRRVQSTLEAERVRQAGELAELNLKIETQARLFDATLSHLSDLVYTFDRDGRVVYANRALLELWGRSLPEVLGKNVFELGYPQVLAERLHGELLQVVATGLPIGGETYFRNAGGLDDMHEYVYNPVFDEEGKVVAVAGSTRIITERKRTESASRQLAAIVESSDDAIVSKNLDGIIMTWNKGAERLFGYLPDEIVGRPVMVLVPDGRQDEEVTILRRIRAGERLEHYETVRRRKDGSFVEVSLTVSPIKDENGTVVGASKIARDITEQKRIEKAATDARDAAEAANKSKDQFLAVLSHELRTPLTPVLMSVAARETSPNIPPELRSEMQMIRRNVELEIRLIDDLLDLSRITSGKLSLRLETVDLREILQHVCEICRPQILEKGIRLHCDFAPELPGVEGDPSRLQQVLWNVLKNAAKFTPEGGDIFVAAGNAPDGGVRVEIRDTGTGIPLELLPKVFDAFEQGDSRMTRKFGGLGLGLAISKALIDLHGGSIRVDSEGLARGSTFTIDLAASTRFSKPPVQRTTTGGRPSDSLIRLLIVEDHEDTAMMLARLLEASGYQVMTAGSVCAALELADSHPFDLLVSDVGLPDATGYELMQKVRVLHNMKGVAMSGYGMDEDIRKSRAAGFSEHLVKPVDISVLERSIRRVLEAGDA